MGVEGLEKGDQAYSYDEAIAITGTGWYNRGLLIVLSLALMAMCVDMMNLSVVLTLSKCDFALDLTQKSIMLSMPFAGTVLTSYLWGYISDTRGRHKSLFIAMWCSFIINSLSAFSTNWIVLAIFKFVGTCFSSCAQSATFTLLGESCPNSIKGPYMLVMSSIIHFAAPVMYVSVYYVGMMDFSYDLGLVTFVPWRFLIIILTLPLGLSAIGLMFFYESPKFLLNIGREEKTLEVLKSISGRNGVVDSYPVCKLVLNEDGNVRRKDMPLLQSMLEQTVPLFKRPLLTKTLLLFYLILVAYFINTSLYVWMAVLAEAFTASSAINETQSQDLCSIMSWKASIAEESDCRSGITGTVVIVVVINGCTYGTLNALTSAIASRRKLIIFSIYFFAAVTCFATAIIPNQLSSLFYFGILSVSVNMGPISTYYIDLFPTSFRGMAACLGSMVARISSTAGINFVGLLIMSHCTFTFYSLSALLLSGAMMSFFLPPDNLNKI